MDDQYFWAMLWDQKVSTSHIELYQLIPERNKGADCRIWP